MPQERPKEATTYFSCQDDGTPLIPIILNMQALERKDIMWTFVTWHYHRSCLVHGYIINGSAQAKHVANKVPVFLGLQLVQTLVFTYCLNICCGIASLKSLLASQARRLQSYWSSGEIGKCLIWQMS